MIATDGTSQKSAQSPTLVADTPTLGDAQDFSGFDEVMCICHKVSGTGTVYPKIQESADGSTGWTDVPGSTLADAVLAGETVISWCNLGNRKRYLRTWVQAYSNGAVGLAILVGTKPCHTNEAAGLGFTA